jgi:hypothetical protein
VTTSAISQIRQLEICCFETRGSWRGPVTSNIEFWAALIGLITALVTAFSTIMERRRKSQDSSKLDTTRRWSRLRKFTPTIIGVVLIAVLLGLGTLYKGHEASPVQVQESVDITKPEDEETVLQPFDLQGTATVARDHDVWILYYAPGQKQYSLFDPGPVSSSNGNWTRPRLWLGRPDGEDKGARYSIYALIMTAEGSEQLADKYNITGAQWLDELPTEFATRQDRIDVILGN